jgi:hypothetical protein
MAKLVPLARSPVPKAGSKLAGAHQGKTPTGSFIQVRVLRGRRVIQRGGTAPDRKALNSERTCKT